MSARVVREKKYENEAERKKAYRERMKNELGLDKYLEQQRLKKKEQRARAKTKQPDNKLNLQNHLHLHSHNNNQK